MTVLFLRGVPSFPSTVTHDFILIVLNQYSDHEIITIQSVPAERQHDSLVHVDQYTVKEQTTSQRWSGKGSIHARTSHAVYTRT